MGLKVVGTGFGRTGTNSLKLALEQLGFGPCHHMFEVANRPDQLAFWQAAARGETPDWDVVFAGFSASVDWPSARYWRELTTHFAGARVLHSVRPVDDWLASMRATIFASLRSRDEHPPGPRRDRAEMAHEIIVNQTFAGRPDDDAHVKRAFEDHTAAVIREIPPDRLLVFDVAEGWEPLCQFLGVPAPDTPFPRTNSTAEFQQRRAEHAR